MHPFPRTLMCSVLPAAVLLATALPQTASAKLYRYQLMIQEHCSEMSNQLCGGDRKVYEALMASCKEYMQEITALYGQEICGLSEQDTAPDSELIRKKTDSHIDSECKSLDSW